MFRDNTKLICDVGEIGGLFTDSTSLESFLQKTVEMIAQHMNSQVCSIYLYNEEQRDLTLSATKGLNQEHIGQLRLKLGEGLTGLALKELRVIEERCASQNPNFKCVENLGEEQYESFLAVPIFRGATKIGAIVIQNKNKAYFSANDEQALRAITSQLANTIEMTRLFMSINEQKKPSTDKTVAFDSKFLKGQVGSPGFAFAQAIVLENDLLRLEEKVSQSKRVYSLAEFQKALRTTEIQLEFFQKNVEEKLSDVASLIFSAQILMLKDQSFYQSIVKLVEQGMNPPKAIMVIVDDYVQKFQKIDNAYLREKSQDVRDIGRRLVSNLLGDSEDLGKYNQCIVISREMLPSEVLKLSSQRIKGLVLLSGGTTSHVSILAQSLQIPLIIVDEPKLINLPELTSVLMDAQEGNIYIDPSKDIKHTYEEKEKLRERASHSKGKIKGCTRSRDGLRIQLMANINLLGDLQYARDVKADGIGLYRTEFPFIVRSDFPSEEEQYVIYQRLTEGMKGKEITFRTLDIGGDKVLSYFESHVKENNPFLGMRSIRFSLRHEEIFSQQIRAILRAGYKSDLRIMFPMISSIDEFVSARNIVDKCLKQLKDLNIKHHSQPKIGMMIELPAVVQIMEELALEADFFSIGTNDFIQYMLAVDRTNEKVSDLYLPEHPAILRALKIIVSTANKHQKDISICGDMAHQKQFLSYFLGVGIKKLSLNPAYIPEVQEVIESININEAEEQSRKLLTVSKLSEMKKMIINKG